MKNSLPARQMAILAGTDNWLERQISLLSREQQKPVYLNQENFSNAKNLLGREFNFIIYDARQALNLEALAVAAGTLKAGGVMLMLFNYWQHLTEQKDADSLRWSGEQQAISTPQFMVFFQANVAKYGIPVYQEGKAGDNPQGFALTFRDPLYTSLPEIAPTPQQAQIIDEILQRQADIYIVTAKRGRGKSALAGLLAKALDSALSAIGRLSCKQRERIILTAPNKSAVGILQDFAQYELNFMAPDELFLRIQQAPECFRHDWLLIDEAAMIPLDLLDCLTSAFKHVLCTTTIHSYEGTGRGFLLKFIANIDRTFRYFELHKPLRWAEDDLPERFIDDLLLLDCEDRLAQPAYALDAAVNIMPVSQSALINSGKIADFYGLLTLAHYRTTPLDLRRLFDAPRQQFWLAQNDHRLIGCVWALEEGGLQDFALITDICRGIRRPKGNLVAQSLAFQRNLPQACELKSLRISRIAVQPNWQHHRIGVRLIDEIVNTTETDFLSVSFGYTEVLARFWQKCGFNLVHLGEYKEATSGCYSAIALRPISPAGMKLAEKAAWHFRRNIGLSFHPLADQFEFEPDWRLTDEDWVILQNFSNFNRTLSSSLAAIRRLLAISDTQECPLLMSYCTKQPNINMESGGKKSWLTQCRQEIQRLLQKHEIDSNIKHGLK